MREQWCPDLGKMISLLREHATRFSGDRIFGDAIRDKLGLPIVPSPYEAAQTAVGYSVSDMSSEGYRYLLLGGKDPVAAARDETHSVLTLVPLSHYLTVSVPELESIFRSEAGYSFPSNWSTHYVAFIIWGFVRRRATPAEGRRAVTGEALLIDDVVTTGATYAEVESSRSGVRQVLGGCVNGLCRQCQGRGHGDRWE